jgi:hypothetical protein
LIIAILIGWEAISRSGLWNPILFPPLEKIGRELVLFFTRPESLLEAWVSLQRAFAGFALAALAGVTIGMLMGRSAWLAALLDPLFSGTYAVPKLALFPIFIFAFGIGSLSKVALVFLECLYPIVIVTSQGARGVSRVLLWSAANMGASRAAALRRVVFPLRHPSFAGLRIALLIARIRDHHRDGELGRRPRLSRHLLALVAAHRPHARGGGGHRRARLAARSRARGAARPVGILGKARNLLRIGGAHAGLSFFFPGSVFHHGSGADPADHPLRPRLRR